MLPECSPIQLKKSTLLAMVFLLLLLLFANLHACMKQKWPKQLMFIFFSFLFIMGSQFVTCFLGHYLWKYFLNSSLTIFLKDMNLNFWKGTVFCISFCNNNKKNIPSFKHMLAQSDFLKGKWTDYNKGTYCNN